MGEGHLERRYRYHGRECKGRQLIRSKRGVKFISDLLDVLAGIAFPFKVIAEKRYLIAAHIVETYFDPFYNAKIAEGETGDPDARKDRASFFYRATDTVLFAFEDAFRSGDSARLDEDLERWIALARGAGEHDVADTLIGARGNLESAATEYDTVGLRYSPSASILALVFQLMEQGIPGTSELWHDEIYSHEDTYKSIFAEHANALSSEIMLADGFSIRLGFENLRSIRFLASEAHPVVRASDYICSAINRYTKDLFAGRSPSAGLRNLNQRILSDFVANAFTQHLNGDLPHPQLGGAIFSEPAYLKLMASLAKS